MYGGGMGRKHYFFKTIFKSLIFKNNNRSCTRRAQSQWGVDVKFAAIIISIKLSSTLILADPARAENFWKQDGTAKSNLVSPLSPAFEKRKETEGSTAAEDNTSSHDSATNRKNKSPAAILHDGAAKNTPLKSAQKKAQDIRRRLKTAESKVKSTSKEEAQILNQLNKTERMLHKTRTEIRSTQRKHDKILKKINTHQSALKNLEEKISAQEVYASKRLIALYKLSWLGQLPILASADTGYDLFKRRANLEFILKQDHMTIDLLQQEKKKLKQMLSELDKQKAIQKNIEILLNSQKNTLSVQLAKRVRFLDQIQKQKDLQLATIDSLKNSAEILDRTISSLTIQIPPSPNEPDGSDIAFYKLKGLLNLPVKGKIIHFYGRFKNKKLNVDNFRTGITIQADRGEPIRSVGSGYTIFADWFRGYGNMIIIDHGDHYYTIYAHLEEIFKSTGDRVEADEVIATVGDTGSMSGTGLHFEVRHHGKPLDPMIWIRKG